MSTSVSFAKIVGDATETMWSQVYHAGDLFAVVSLTTVEDHPELNSMGKDFFNTLEDNFFSLEEKKLTTIKAVIAENLKQLPPEVTVSACIAYSKDAVLYLFVVGNGEILMRRGEKIGLLLTQKEGSGHHILSSSGYLEHGDILLLQTEAFSHLLKAEEIRESLELHLPNAITENLSSRIDELPGNAACLSLMYQGASSPHEEPLAKVMLKKHKAAEPSAKTSTLTPEDEETDGETEEETPPEESSETNERAVPPLEADEEKPRSDSPVFSRVKSLPVPSRKLLLGGAALIIVVLLIGSILFTKQNGENVESRSVYEQTLREATEKYDEAEGLKNLNAALAQDDYRSAQQIIKTNLPKIKKGSPEEKELLTLLGKIEANLQNAEGASVEATEGDLADNPLLALASEKSTPYVTEDEGKRFALLSSGIVNGEGEEVIKNEDDWEKPAGISGYNGNLYVLDRDGAVLKFTPGGDGYNKSSYFSGEAPSLTDAAGIAIDGSVWILFSDGEIKKYTRGKDDGFKVTGLPSSMSNPKFLYTSGDTEKLYVLDQGNSRVMVIGKDGAFEKAYKADVLKAATVIQADEAEDRLFILANKKLYTISME